MKSYLALLGGSLWLFSLAGCASNPPGTTDGGDAQTGIDGNACGAVGGSCCPSLPLCVGSVCAGGRCCSPTGTGCSTRSDCCGDLSCDASKCCVPSGRPCRDVNECCGGLLCFDGLCRDAPDECGVDQGPCCPEGGGTCRAGLECVESRCVECGGLDEACCKPPSACETPMVCGSDRKCGAPDGCGLEGLPCCAGDDPCVGVLSCVAGTCRGPSGDCDHPECGSCVSDPGRGCGFCEGTGCLAGDEIGPTTGDCTTGEWQFGPGACGAVDTCGAHDGDCGACTTAPSGDCGMCPGTGTCHQGDSEGPHDGSCEIFEWQWLASECDTTAVDTCPMHPGDCTGCTSDPSLRCGFCSNTGTCHQGDSVRADDGTCGGADWNWVASQCSASDPCESLTTCGACLSTSDSVTCGYCVDTGACQSSPGSCSNYTTTDCGGSCLPLYDSSCSTDSQCCDASCRRGVTFSTRCCREIGGACTSSSDCCGWMLCGASSTCICQSSGGDCLDPRDCCSGTCTSGTCA